MYSVTSRESFDHIRAVHHQAMLERQGGKPTFILAGNMCDKQYAREVSYEEGEQLAQELGCPFLETSARTVHNVHRLFMVLVRLMRDAQQMAPAESGSGRSEAKNRGMRRLRNKGCVTM